MSRLLTIAAVVLALQPLTAQIVKLDNCVHQSGDTPEWARPRFDDSQWSSRFPAIGSPYVWTRCKLDLRSLPPNGPLEIAVDTRAAWELFVNGEPAGSFGDIHTGFASTMSRQHRPLPAAAMDHESAIVALRLLPGRTVSYPSTPVVMAGARDAVMLHYAEQAAAALGRQWPRLLGDAFNLAMGIALLVLWISSGGAGQQRQKELFWFGLFVFTFGVESYLRFSLSLLSYPYWIFAVFYRLLEAVTVWAGPRIFFAFVGRSLPTFFHLTNGAQIVQNFGVTALILLAPVELAQRVCSWDYLPFLTLLAVPLCLAPLAAFWPLDQVPKEQRLFCGLSLVWSVAGLAIVVPLLPVLEQVPGLRNAGLNLNGLLGIPVLLAMFVVIAQRHRRVASERAELQGEMRSAQEVQRLLTSSAPDVAPWAAVDVAYFPAKEVGGDFYFSRQTLDGQLVIVGDVSGKGLRAAMLASVALGAIRNSSKWSPGPLLENLNAALHGQTGGGFVTCCAVLLHRNGGMIMANAGHLSAYVAGREFTPEAGLPLGIVPDATYVESATEGDRVTVVSDGVVEAENKDRELFGFDRTREISVKTAAEIAEAARAWGQTDDITVVTVRRVP